MAPLPGSNPGHPHDRREYLPLYYNTSLPPTYTSLDDIPDIIPPVIPTNLTIQLPPEPITPIHNTENQAHSPQQLSPNQVQTTENQAHSPPPSTSVVQQQTPTVTQSSATQHAPVDQPPIIIPNPPKNPNPVSVNPMVTRFRVGTNRPTKRLTLHVSLVSSLPKSYHDTFSDPNWQNAMCNKYHALIKNKTWTLVPRPPDTNIVRCMWIFRHKYLADGTLSRYKARLVASGSTQLEGVDVDETFSPVVKPGTIRTVLSLAASRHWSIQLDVMNAFLHGDLSETVYMHQPLGFQDSVHLDYKKYAVEILKKAHMVICNPSRTPIDTESKLCVDGDPVYDLTLYQSLAGSFQYLTFTRSDISYAVQQVCLHMHDSGEPHLSALKRILRYVQGTLHYGLQLFSSSTTDVVAYADADWAGCHTTRRSTSGYCVFIGNNLLSWSSKRQPMLSRSSAKAEYRGVANAVAETCRLRNLLRELHTPLSFATLVYFDNVSAVYLSCNPVQHQRTKHIEVDIHLVRDLIATGQVRVLHVPSRYQFADIFTKGLPSALFEEFRTNLSVRCPPAPTAGEC
nr:ribonuclease H-like domain-containing protein [Tanacetum cinerariifolium]